METRTDTSMDAEYEGMVLHEPRGWLDRLDWAGVRQEVEMESRAEIVLLGMGNAGKSTLFNSLRGWPVTLTALKLGRAEGTVEECLGLFTLIDLPEDGDGDGWQLEGLDRATLLVYLLDGAVGCSGSDVSGAIVRPVDMRWIGRLRAMGRPLLIVLNKADLWEHRLAETLATVKRRLGAEVVAISAYDSPEAQHCLLARMVEVCPDLGVPLGREVAAFRRTVAQRLTRRAALLVGLVAAEPIPLLDLPMQLGAQVGLVARIGAVYGHPPASDYSKELVLTGAGSVALRYLAQQVVKAVPVLGWAASGLLGAATTWLVGQAAVAYFEGYASPEQVRSRWSDLWQRRVRAWWKRLAGTVQRRGPVAWALRQAGGLRERWRARRGDSTRGGLKDHAPDSTQYAIRFTEVKHGLADTKPISGDGTGSGS
jgi:uncharacterized protein (DUF697 family)